MRIPRSSRFVICPTGVARFLPWRPRRSPTRRRASSFPWRWPSLSSCRGCRRGRPGGTRSSSTATAWSCDARPRADDCRRGRDGTSPRDQFRGCAVSRRLGAGEGTEAGRAAPGPAGAGAAAEGTGGPSGLDGSDGGAVARSPTGTRLPWSVVSLTIRSDGRPDEDAAPRTPRRRTPLVVLPPRSQSSRAGDRSAGASAGVALEGPNTRMNVSRSSRGPSSLTSPHLAACISAR